AFIAGRDEMAEAEIAPLSQPEGIGAERSALGGKRHRTLARPGAIERRCEGAEEAALDAEQAEAVRPDQADAALARLAAQPVLGRPAGIARFGEAGGENLDGFDPLRRTVVEGTLDEGRRHRDDGVVDAIRNGVDRGIARYSLN